MVPRFQSLFSRSERTYEEKTRVSVDEEDSFEDAGGELTPLSAVPVADAFKQLSALMKSKDCNFDLRLKRFCDACSLVSVLFTSLGIAFKFAELEYVSKVSDLADASKG